MATSAVSGALPGAYVSPAVLAPGVRCAPPSPSLAPFVTALVTRMVVGRSCLEHTERHMFNPTNWPKKEGKESKESDVNAVHFLFTPNILVVKTIICCSACVKL